MAPRAYRTCSSSSSLPCSASHNRTGGVFDGWYHLIAPASPLVRRDRQSGTHSGTAFSVVYWPEPWRAPRGRAASSRERKGVPRWATTWAVLWGRRSCSGTRQLRRGPRRSRDTSRSCGNPPGRCAMGGAVRAAAERTRPPARQTSAAARSYGCSVGRASSVRAATGTS